ncbi:MAG: molybdenum cofactor synthesis domain-containing protein [Thermoguttaceae bacterium]|jgi:molybdenum cofactor synthesis domain-containing protein
MGRVEAVCISQRKGERKTPVAQATFAANHGIEGDAHAGAWHRQVSLLDGADIDEVRRNGLPDLQPGAFAENLVVSGLKLGELGLGSQIRLGTSVVLSITQIGKTCHAPCRIHHLTGDCIMPRRGLFARVEASGQVLAGVEAVVTHSVARATLQAVVLTISDRCSRAESVDTAGPAIASLLQGGLGAHVFANDILPDEKDTIGERLRHYCDGHSIDLVVTVGGTGFGPRDVTPEATRSVVERFTPGLDEAMRAASLQCSPHAMLSRGASGIRGRTLILNLPGSVRAASENLSVVLPALPHGLATLRGEVSDCGRPISLKSAHV